MPLLNPYNQAAPSQNQNPLDHPTDYILKPTTKAMQN